MVNTSPNHYISSAPSPILTFCALAFSSRWISSLGARSSAGPRGSWCSGRQFRWAFHGSPDSAQFSETLSGRRFVSGFANKTALARAKAFLWRAGTRVPIVEQRRRYYPDASRLRSGGISAVRLQSEFFDSGLDGRGGDFVAAGEGVEGRYHDRFGVDLEVAAEFFAGLASAEAVGA